MDHPDAPQGKADEHVFLVGPVDQSTICMAMSGTPSLFKYKIDPTGSAATYIWPANIELPEILSVGNYKPRKSMTQRALIAVPKISADPIVVSERPAD
jgi:hypothetical protein